MGRPLNKRLFGTPAAGTDTIKVQFHNGTASVKGYIVKQKGAKWFQCKDASGNVAVCKLVDKASAALAAGEMTITVKYDNLDVDQVTKISGRNVTVKGHQEHWTFNTSTSDGYVQMEEAGTNAALASGVDLEGDDINGDYPVPGSGTTPYKLGATGLSGIAYANKGTPFAPGANIATVSNSAAGLLRKKYDGNFTAGSASAPSTWTYDFFDDADLIKEIADTYVSWGQQLDGPGLGESQFSMEWKGYVQVPTTQNYNFYGESDDHIAMWIGTNALNAPADGTYLFASNNKTLPGSGEIAGATVTSNSVTLTAGQWYPVRIWFSEHTGGCKAQIYAQGADGAKFAGSELTFAYNTATGGFNP